MLGNLERKEELTRAMVERVETQVSCLRKNVPEEKKEEYK